MKTDHTWFCGTGPKVFKLFLIVAHLTLRNHLILMFVFLNKVGQWYISI